MRGQFFFFFLKLLILGSVRGSPAIRGSELVGNGPYGNPLEGRAANCKNLALSIPATAENVVFPPTLNVSSLTQQDFDQVTSLPKTTVSDTYTITATYCEPANLPARRRKTLQLLLHGITYDKSYWFGKYQNGTAYSWVDYATKQGYPTLAIDRICNGGSTKANGLLVCQLPTNAAVIHGVIQQVRSGQAVPGRKFSKVIAVSHSEGSVIANFHSQVYPKDADSYILTGFTNHLLFSSLGDFLAIKPLPAALIEPTKYASLLLDPAYLIATDPIGNRGIFYYGSFNQKFVDYDFKTRGAFPVSEFLTAPLGQLPAFGFTGSVLVLNGQQDQIFCAILPTDPAIGGKGQCGTGDSSFSAQSKILYPNAKSYKWKQIPNTGHNVNLHYSASKTFKAAHDFMAAEGF